MLTSREAMPSSPPPHLKQKGFAMNDDLIFKPFLDIPTDYNPATNPNMTGVLSRPNQFKTQLKSSLGNEWLKSLLIGVGVAVCVAVLVICSVATIITLPFLGPIIIVAVGWTTIAAFAFAALVAAVVTHRVHHWLKSSKIEKVPKVIKGSIDKLACFMAATVFRVYFEKDPQQIQRRFTEWGYADTWANDALCILQREDINIKNLITTCTTKKDLKKALRQCGLPSSVITLNMMRRLLEVDKK